MCDLFLWHCDVDDVDEKSFLGWIFMQWNKSSRESIPVAWASLVTLKSICMLCHVTQKDFPTRRHGSCWSETASWQALAEYTGPCVVWAVHLNRICLNALDSSRSDLSPILVSSRLFPLAPLSSITEPWLWHKRRSWPPWPPLTWSRCGRGTWGRCWSPGTRALRAAGPCRRWAHSSCRITYPCNTYSWP